MSIKRAPITGAFWLGRTAEKPGTDVQVPVVGPIVGHDRERSELSTVHDDLGDLVVTGSLARDSSAPAVWHRELHLNPLRDDSRRDRLAVEGFGGREAVFTDRRTRHREGKAGRLADTGHVLVARINHQQARAVVPGVDGDAFDTRMHLNRDRGRGERLLDGRRALVMAAVEREEGERSEEQVFQESHGQFLSFWSLRGAGVQDLRDEECREGRREEWLELLHTVGVDLDHLGRTVDMVNQR